MAGMMDSCGIIKTEVRKIGALIPFARNSRTHSDEQVAQIAGEMTGRSIHAIELNPAYVDVAVKRWQDFTGLEAIHEKTGHTFAHVATTARELVVVEQEGV